jgi:hypothetical protein
MGLPSSTKHQNDHNLPDVLRGTVFAAIPQRDHVALDFTTHAGSHLELHIPRSLFDALCARLGNAYKAGCWVAARCGEVDTLSRQSMERYVNMMTCDKLGLERGSSRVLRITVSSITAPEPSAKD